MANNHTNVVIPPQSEQATDPLEAVKAYTALVEHTHGKTLGERNNIAEWQSMTVNVLKDLFLNLLDKHKLSPERVQIFICGSLARFQATPYSDLDLIAILPKDITQEERAKVAELARDFNQACIEHFLETNQFATDRVFLNPDKLCGTVEELKTELQNSIAGIHSTENNKLANVISDPLMIPLLNGRPLFYQIDNKNLLNDLLIAMREEKDEENFRVKVAPYLPRYFDPNCYYHAAVHRFPGPNKEMTEFNLKDHILRPLDFIMTGLRLEYNIVQEDNSELSLQKTLLHLLNENKIEPNLAYQIMEVHAEAMSLRYCHHIACRSEADVLPKDDYATLLAKMQNIRMQIDNSKLAKTNNPVQDAPSKSSRSWLNPGMKAATVAAVGILATVAVGLAIASIALTGGASLAVYAVAAGIGAGLVLGAMAITALVTTGISYIKSQTPKPKIDSYDTLTLIDKKISAQVKSANVLHTEYEQDLQTIEQNAVKNGEQRYRQLNSQQVGPAHLADDETRPVLPAHSIRR
jgi:predicted nucleotidyltransferase